jgi:hypothetical protein
MHLIPIPKLDKGTLIDCANGHTVCEVTDDILLGSTGYSAKIGNWRRGQTPAKKGDPLPLRCACGAIYFEKAQFPHTRT